MPCSFVEPLWSSLLAEAICINLQGGRSIVSPHARTCWSNKSRCGRNLARVFWALRWASFKNKFASAEVTSAGTVFFEIGALFSSCAVTRNSLTRGQLASFRGSYKKKTTWLPWRAHTSTVKLLLHKTTKLPLMASSSPLLDLRCIHK